MVGRIREIKFQRILDVGCGTGMSTAPLVSTWENTEYLFDKLQHKKAQDSRFSLKEELIDSFNLFPKLLKNESLSVDDISNRIKEIRRTIAHGYVYYYDFKNNIEAKRLILLLDKLIRNMSLRWIGFSKEDISDYGII